MTSFVLSTFTIAAIAGVFLLAGCATDRGAGVSMTAVSAGYICPLTGEELPCPDCCPLNQDHADAAPAGEVESEDGYVCPLTGETLPCPKCCPLNQS